MIKFARRIMQRGLQVCHLQIWHFLEDLIGRKTGREKIQHIDDSNAHAANARAAPALLRIYRNSLKQFRHEFEDRTFGVGFQERSRIRTELR